MTTNAASAGQVSTDAVEIYDAFFVPALFGQWAAPLCDAARVGPGTDVLDVACGTGATTRKALDRVGTRGRVVGLDRNAGMLAVARKTAASVNWVAAQAEDIPFEDAHFDVVLCQFGLMFFDDPAKALGEMRRTLRPGGRIAISVWDDVSNSPGYAGMIALIEEMFGQAAADALRAPFALGRKGDLAAVLAEGGLIQAQISTHEGVAEFASIADWVRTDVRGWTLADLIDDAGCAALIRAAEQRLKQFTDDTGRVRFAAPAHFAVWTKA